jgi:hypothetical protein
VICITAGRRGAILQWEQQRTATTAARPDPAGRRRQQRSAPSHYRRVPHWHWPPCPDHHRMMCTLLLLSCQLLASGAAAAPAAADVSSSPSALPQRRLIVNGSTISDPRTPTVPLKLRGFNFWIDLSSGVEPEDRAVSSILPGTNFARLVMVHWQDTANGTDCYDAAGTPSTGYLRTECLTMFDDAIKWSTGAGLWTVLTARAKGAGAAGSTPSSTTGILNSPKLTAGAKNSLLFLSVLPMNCQAQTLERLSKTENKTVLLRDGCDVELSGREIREYPRYRGI